MMIGYSLNESLKPLLNPYKIKENAQYLFPRPSRRKLDIDHLVIQVTAPLLHAALGCCALEADHIKKCYQLFDPSIDFKTLPIHFVKDISDFIKKYTQEHQALFAFPDTMSYYQIDPLEITNIFHAFYVSKYGNRADIPLKVEQIADIMISIALDQASHHFYYVTDKPSF